MVAGNIHWDGSTGSPLCQIVKFIRRFLITLGLGNEARMNIPGTIANNWQWRLRPGALTRSLAKRLRRLAELSARA